VIRFALALGGRVAAEVVHAYRARIAELDPPKPAATGRPAEHSCTGLSTERSWSRTVSTSATATALDGAGFTARRRDA